MTKLDKRGSSDQPNGQDTFNEWTSLMDEDNVSVN